MRLALVLLLLVLIVVLSVLVILILVLVVVLSVLVVVLSVLIVVLSVILVLHNDLHSATVRQHKITVKFPYHCNKNGLSPFLGDFVCERCVL